MPGASIAQNNSNKMPIPAGLVGTMQLATWAMTEQ